MTDLFRNHLQKLLSKWYLISSFAHFLKVVQIQTETFKNDNDMLSKPEAVNHLYKTIKAFIINITIEILEFIQNFYFNICVINIKFLILANLSSYYPLIRIFVIYTLNNLTKCSLINQLNDLVTISNMFSYSY